jgi:hypothetical protein
VPTEEFSMTDTEIFAELNRATHADQETRTQITRALASHPDEVFAVLYDALETPPRGYWQVAVDVIQAIGTPRNLLAIPRLLDHIVDLNSPVARQARQALAEMGTEPVVPYLIEKLLDKNRSGNSWFEAIAGICSMLGDVERDFAVLCGPAIASLLVQQFPVGELDPGYLLDVLEKIGPECAVYALPSLIRVVKAEGNSEIGQQARALIVSFNQEVVAPYKYLLGEPHPIFVRKTRLQE